MPRHLEVITAADMIDMVAPLGLELTDELPASSHPGDFIGLFRGLQDRSEELAGIDPFKEGERAKTRQFEVGHDEGRVRVTAFVDPVMREKEPRHPNGKVSGQVHSVTIERPFVTSRNFDPRKLFVSLTTMRAGLVGRQSAFITSKSGYQDLRSGEYTTEPDRWIMVGGETDRDQFPDLVEADDSEMLAHHQKRLWVGSQILRTFQPDLFTEVPNPVSVAAVKF